MMELRQMSNADLTYMSKLAAGQGHQYRGSLCVKQHLRPKRPAGKAQISADTGTYRPKTGHVKVIITGGEHTQDMTQNSLETNHDTESESFTDHTLSTPSPTSESAESDIDRQTKSGAKLTARKSKTNRKKSQAYKAAEPKLYIEGESDKMKRGYFSLQTDFMNR